MFLTLIISGAWVVIFSSYMKLHKFLTKYLLFLFLVAIVFTITMFIPSVVYLEGYYLWVLCGAIVSIGMGTGLCVQNDKYYKNTGKRSIFLWEITK
jgi:hypothetical protein